MTTETVEKLVRDQIAASYNMPRADYDDEMNLDKRINSLPNASLLAFISLAMEKRFGEGESV